MNVATLIDAIVRQTTVMIAQLATSSGNRAHLAHTANQVFLDLVHALRDQGVGSKVIADMFGMALRTYRRGQRRRLAPQSLEDLPMDRRDVRPTRLLCIGYGSPGDR